MGNTSSNIEEFDVPGQDLTSIRFTINGIPYILNPLVPLKDGFTPNARLVDYIRDFAGLKGTKTVCREGGCGACIVIVGGNAPRAVNSCLVPLWAIDGWDITTIEGVGSSRTGYHAIQKKIAETGGTQCGYCTPGMIMNMHGFLQSGNRSKMEIQEALDGNICRCTGYRPILDAFKSFGNDKSEECCVNSEDGIIRSCKNCPNENFSSVEVQQFRKLHLKFASGQEWVRPIDLGSLFDILGRLGRKRFKLLAGNTGAAILEDSMPSYEYIIDISAISELKAFTLAEGQVLTLGGGLTLAEAINIFQKAAQLRSFPYAGRMAVHLSKISGTAIRNRATIGGNLMLKYLKKDFPSDLFTLLGGVGASIRVCTGPNIITEMTPEAFLSTRNLLGLILNIGLPFQLNSSQYFFNSYRVSRRYQNDGAILNIAVQFTFDGETLRKPSIVFGGLGPLFTHARATEDFLLGKNLSDPNILKSSLEILDAEFAQFDGKRQMALNLFYKMVLALFQNKLDPKIKSGSWAIPRRLTSGVQKFDSDQKTWPLGKPVAKIEALTQTGGELEYITDIPKLSNELFGEFVLANVGSAQIGGIDPREALLVPGVVTFISAKDVPGENNFFAEGLMSKDFFPTHEFDEIFASKEIKFAGQAIGLILGRSKEAAQEGVRRVLVKYINIRKPQLGFGKHLDIKSEVSVTDEGFEMLQLEASPNKVKGQFIIPSQFHFSMENHSCLAIPREDGKLEVISSTQWMGFEHHVVAKALNLPFNAISMSSRRLGGAFGLKISRGAQAAVAASLGAWKTRQSVRIHTDLDTTFRLSGKRTPQLLSYETTFDPKSGRISSHKPSIIMDVGCNSNESLKVFTNFYIQSCYKGHGWEWNVDHIQTNTASNTMTRNPQSIGGAYLCEILMEHIAKISGKDPIEVRRINLLQKGDELLMLGIKMEEENPLNEMIKELMNTSQYHQRKAGIEKFNAGNRWKKRGIGFSCYRYLVPLGFFFDYTSVVSIYQQDGTISISHTAVEMGQGINTKCAQVVAHVLGVPVEKVRVLPMDNLVAPQTTFTGSSFSSNLSTYSVQMAAQKLMARLEPIKKKLGKEYTWEKLTHECWNEKIELSATYKPTKEDHLQQVYNTWGCILTEVLIDVLTGENKITRVDALIDAGISLNPQVDIGQIEGALVYGFGNLLTERVIYDEVSGQWAGKGTFDYKPPMAKDIPEDFRIALWRNTEKHHPKGTLGAKAVGEGPLILSISVLIALRNAIDAARKDAGVGDIWYQMDAPVGPEDIVRLCMTSKENLTYN